MDSAEFEIEFEVECLTDKGNLFYTTITKEIEVGGQWDYEDGYRSFFDVNENELEDLTSEAEENYVGDPDSIEDCDCRLGEDGIIGEDEHVIEVRSFQIIENDFEILSEDLSFNYSDSGHTTHLEHDIHGFTVKTGGTNVYINTLRGYGEAFKNIRMTVKSPKELYNFIEHYKQVQDYDNFINVCNVRELENLQELLKKREDF